MNLIEALETANIDFRNGRESSEIWLCCPNCNDQRFRLGVNIETGLANCFNCSWKSRGDYTFNKLKEWLDTGEIEAKQAERKKEKKIEKIELPEGFRYLQHPDTDDEHWNKIAWRFARKRGLTREQIKDKKIGFSVIGDFAYRLIFPVFLRNELVGLVGRDFTGQQEPKYRNSVGSKVIYNLPEKKHSSICLSEGPFDALIIEKGAKKLGIDSGALLGHSLKEEQLYLLKKYKRIYLWLDADEGGIAGFSSLRKIIPKDKIVYVVIPKGFLEGEEYDSRDPSELDTVEVVKRLEKAKVLTEGLVQLMQTTIVFQD